MARSVADQLREERRREDAAMTPAERIGLALELSERDLALYCSTNGMSREQALRELERRSQEGRLPSRVMSA